MVKAQMVEFVRYYPGVVGKVVELHATYYHRHWGFDVSFETQVARELADFILGFVPGRDGFWAARWKGHFAGSIAIDGSNESEEGARLRWFIVDPRFQGRGIGSALLNKALAFCRQTGHKRVFLWTFKGLDTARRLYERSGFSLSLEHEVSQWGAVILEQRFDWEEPD